MKKWVSTATLQMFLCGMQGEKDGAILENQRTWKKNVRICLDNSSKKIAFISKKQATRETKSKRKIHTDRCAIKTIKLH